jgi:hypothetical protein
VRGAVAGLQPVGANLRDRRGDDVDRGPVQGRVVVVGQQDPLAARRSLRLERGAQPGIAHLPAQVRFGLPVDQPQEPRPAGEPDRAQLVLEVGDRTVQRQQPGDPAEGRAQPVAVRPVGLGDDVRGVELEQRRVRRLCRHVRQELDRAGPGAHDRDPAAGQVVVVPPGGRVERRAGEVAEPGQRGDGGAGELAAGRDQYTGLVGGSVGEAEHPGAAAVVEARLGHLDAESDPRQHAEPLGDLLQVLADLRLRRITPGPVALRREREGVEGRRDVAGGARIAVGRPHPAHAIGALEDRDVADAGPGQPDGHPDAAEAGADDGDRGGAACQRDLRIWILRARSRYGYAIAARTHR